MHSCSICFSKKAEKDLRKDEILIEKQLKTLVEVVEFCLGLQISNTAGTNTKMCNKCTNKLITFHKFKSLALQSQNFMKILYEVDEKKNIINKIKQEDLCYDEPQVEIENTYPYIGDDHLPDEKHEISDLKLEEYHDVSDDELPWDIKNTKVKENSADDAVDTGGPLESKVKEKDTSLVAMGICDECGMSVANLKQHMLSHKSKGKTPKEYSCPHCNRKFKTSGGRKKHIRTIHLGIKSTCSFCGKMVIDLKGHISKKHNQGDLKHQCSICGMKFLRVCFLNVHMQTHNKEKIYECETCQKKFRTSCTLRMHRQSIHMKLKQHMCQYCSKTFFKKCKLDDHLRKHTNERPYVCECGKAFKSSTTLKTHRRTHGGEDVVKYVCDFCHMAFTIRSRLVVHLVTHTRERKHHCRYCGVGFGRTDHRNRHERTAHNHQS